MAEKDNQFLLTEMQTRFARIKKENEIKTIEYWKEQLEKIASMRPEGVAALQMQIKKTIEMMANRITFLKKA